MPSASSKISISVPKIHIHRAILHLLVCSLALLAIFRICPADAKEHTPLCAHYQLTPNLSNASIHVRARLLHVPANTELCLPAFGQRPGEKLSILQIQDAGEPMLLALNERGCFKNPAQSPKLELEYELAVSHQDAQDPWLASTLSPRADALGLYFPSESLWIDVNNAPDFNVKLKLVLDNATQCASTVQIEQNEANLPYSEIKSSFFVFSQNFTQTLLTNNDTRLKLFTQHDLKLPSLAFSQIIAQILKIFEGWVPMRAPAQINIILLSAPWEAQLSAGFARHHGLVLQMSKSAQSLDFSTLYFLAHELFHHYNGESLRFANSGYEESAWFREGMTNYVALMSLWSAGLITKSETIDQVRKHAQLSRAARLPTPPKHLPYNVGFLMCLAIDAHLLTISSGTLSLRGFWQALSKSPDWRNEQNNASIARALQNFSGLNYADFIELYAVQSASLPTDTIMESLSMVLAYYQ